MEELTFKSETDFHWQVLPLGHQVAHYQAQSSNGQAEGDLVTAINALRKAISAQLHQFKLVKRFNRQFNSRIDTGALVGGLIEMYTRLADLLHRQGFLDDAAKADRDAMRLTQRYLASVRNADQQHRLAQQLIDQGRFNEGKLALIKARSLFESQTNWTMVAKTALAICDLALWMKDYPAADAELKHIRRIFDHLVNESSGQLDAYFDSAVKAVELQRINIELDYYQGLIYRKLGKFEAAVEYFYKALPHYRLIGLGELIECQFAAIDLHQEKTSDAMARLKQLHIAFHQKPPLRAKLCWLMLVTGKAYLKLGKLNHALKQVELGIKDIEVFADPQVEWQLHALRANILQQQESDELAISAYKRCVDAIGDFSIIATNYRSHEQQYQQLTDTLNQAVLLSAKLGQVNLVAFFMAFLQSHETRLICELNQETPLQHPDLVELQQQTRQINALDYQIATDHISRDRAAEQRRQLAGAYRQLISDFEQKDPEFQRLGWHSPFDISWLRRRLKDTQQTVVSIHTIGDTLVAIVLSADYEGISQVTLSETRKTKLERYLANILNEDEHRDKDPLLSTLNLSNLIETNVLEHIFKTQHLVIVSSGQLQSIPWASLLYEGKRLFEHCAVSVMPSLDSLKSLPDDKKVVDKVHIVNKYNYSAQQTSHSLPWNQSALSDLLKKTHSKSTSQGFRLFNDKAHATKFMQAAQLSQHSGLMLISAVCELHEQAPLNTQLLFTDQPMTLKQISGLQLSSRDIVLSLSLITPTDLSTDFTNRSKMALPISFMQAGAHSVLSSVTSTSNDATVEFISHYIQARQSGMAAANAFQITQQHMLATGNRFPIADWVGFQLTSGV